MANCGCEAVGDGFGGDGNYVDFGVWLEVRQGRG